MKRTRVLRGLAVAALVIASDAGCASEAVMIELRSTESAVRMTSTGETLAVGVFAREPYDSSVGLKGRSDLLLVRQGAAAVRALIGPGVLRDLVPVADGFAVVRVQKPGQPGAVALISHVDWAGQVTELPALQLDPLGLWVDSGGAVHAYSRRVVMRWSDGAPTWTRVAVHADIPADSITKIVGVAGGRAAMITDRGIFGFTRLEDPPVFARLVGGYPYPLELYGGGDGWWLVSSNEREQKLIHVALDGTTREVTTLRGVRVQHVMPADGSVLIATTGQGPDIHKRSIVVLDPATGSSEHTRKLPDDTTVTCMWMGAVVSAGPGQHRVIKTVVAR